MKLLDAIAPTRTPATKERGYAEAYFGAGDPTFGQFGNFTTFSVGGQTYTVPISTTLPGQKAETIANSFEGYVLNGLQGNSVIFGLASIRTRVFSEARFAYQRLRNGRPEDLWSDRSLAILEHPWPGGVTGDLLALMMLHADFAGNCYIVNLKGQLVAMRPDWVDIVLASRVVGFEKVGYMYYQGGKMSGVDPVMFAADEVAHFAPMQDPLAWYRGMSWLTPVIREIRSDNAAMDHKLAFFANAATPNLAVKLAITDRDQFDKFVDTMDEKHQGVGNAYKTLYLGAGADVSVIGQSMKDMDFAGLQGRGETRLAMAAGIPAVVAGISEGLQGSSLNAGNFGQSRRQFADQTMFPLWRNVCGSLETVCPPPDSGSRLWMDTRDVPFLREDQKDLAAIQQAKSQAVRELFMAGFEPDAVIDAVNADDLGLLKGHHTGTYSVQVQAPGTENRKLPATTDSPPAGPESAAVAAPEKPAPALAAATNGNGP